MPKDIFPRLVVGPAAPHKDAHLAGTDRVRALLDGLCGGGGKRVDQGVGYVGGLGACAGGCMCMCGCACEVDGSPVGGGGWAGGCCHSCILAHCARSRSCPPAPPHPPHCITPPTKAHPPWPTPNTLLLTCMMPRKVAATSVKLAMPPPTSSARPRPSGCAVAQSSSVRPYRYVSWLLGPPLYSARGGAGWGGGRRAVRRGRAGALLRADPPLCSARGHAWVGAGG